MKNPSFNPKLTEYLNTLSEITVFFEEYSGTLTRKQGGQANEQIEDIQFQLRNAAEGITQAVALEILESEFYNHQTEKI